MKLLSFNDAEFVEMATAYGTLKTRAVSLELDIKGPEGNIKLADLHNMLLDRWGFDLADLVEIRLEPTIHRITFSQKWWDRSERSDAVLALVAEVRRLRALLPCPECKCNVAMHALTCSKGGG